MVWAPLQQLVLQVYHLVLLQLNFYSLHNKPLVYKKWNYLTEFGVMRMQ